MPFIITFKIGNNLFKKELPTREEANIYMNVIMANVYTHTINFFDNQGDLIEAL